LAASHDLGKLQAKRIRPRILFITIGTRGTRACRSLNDGEIGVALANDIGTEAATCLSNHRATYFLILQLNTDT
jgi:hypothetical protein